MKRTATVIAAALLSIAAAAQATAQATSPSTLMVSAASSLTDVLTELQPEAEKAVGAKILLNFGGSGTLRKQIEEGAPADVFFSAAASDMDALEKRGLVDPASRRDLLSNAMVLVGDRRTAPPRDAASLRSLLESAELLAVGNPDSVPAGRYAVQALKSLGLYPLVEKKLVLGGNVREVLQYVESGSAPFGIVFGTDAMTLKPASPAAALFLFPDEALAAPILYPAAVVASSGAKDAAARYVEFLRGDSARRAFEKAGFVLR